MPVLIVSKHRSSGEALEQCLVAGGFVAMRAGNPDEALSLANVLRFRVAVFLGEIDQQAAAAMHELHTRYGTRGVAVVEKGPTGLRGEPAAAFERSLADGVSDATLLKCIRELRESAAKN